MIVLNEEDWLEIFYALETKMDSWGSHDDSCPDHQALCKYLIIHLREIQRKIGSDGRRAWQFGVAPAREDSLTPCTMRTRRGSHHGSRCDDAEP